MTTMDSAASEMATGDGGPWVWHLPRMWRAVADPDGLNRLFARPAVGGGHDWLEERIAWWAPLLQVLAFGCGWPRIDLGLQRWLDAGRPTDDARLALVDRWWGPAVEELLAWGAVEPGLTQVMQRVAEETATTLGGDRLRDEWAELRGGRRWQGTWSGGSDPMHLKDHAVTQVWKSASTCRLVVGERPTAGKAGHAVLLCDGYAGWYRELHRAGATLPHDPAMRSWHIDAVCRPLGWLGTYRRSALTGRWFAGQHRWHQLGAG